MATRTRSKPRTSSGSRAKWQPGLRAPKVRGPRLRAPKLPTIRLADVVWTTLVWLPFHLIRGVGLGLGLVVVGTCVATGKGGRAAWRYSRPHLARAGRWAGNHAHTRARRLEDLAASRWRHRTPPAEPVAVAGAVRNRLEPLTTRLAKVGPHRRAEYRQRTSLGQQTAPMKVAPKVSTADVRPVEGEVIALGDSRPDARKAGTSGARARNTNTTSEGARMQQFQNLVREARVVGELDPKTAWELDEQLAAFAALWPKIAESFAHYAENLDRNVRIDPRIVASFINNVAVMGELYKHFWHTRRLYRQLYREFFERDGVRMPTRKGFWDNKAA